MERGDANVRVNDDVWATTEESWRQQRLRWPLALLGNNQGGGNSETAAIAREVDWIGLNLLLIREDDITTIPFIV